MSTLNNTLKLEWTPGTILSLFEEAVKVAQQTGYRVKYDFNGVEIKVDKHSCFDSCYDKIYNALADENRSFLDLT